MTNSGLNKRDSNDVSKDINDITERYLTAIYELASEIDKTVPHIATMAVASGLARMITTEAALPERMVMAIDDMRTVLDTTEEYNRRYMNLN